MAGRARVGQGCLSDKQGREGAVTLAFPSRYLLAAQGRGRGRAGQGQGRGILSFWKPRVCTPGFQDPKRLGKFLDMVFRTWFSGLGISTLELGKF